MLQNIIVALLILILTYVFIINVHKKDTDWFSGILALSDSLVLCMTIFYLIYRLFFL